MFQGHGEGQMMKMNPPPAETELLYKELIILLHSYRCLKREVSVAQLLITGWALGPIPDYLWGRKGSSPAYPEAMEA